MTRLPKWGAENGAENGKLTAQIKTVTRGNVCASPSPVTSIELSRSSTVKTILAHSPKSVSKTADGGQKRAD